MSKISWLKQHARAVSILVTGVIIGGAGSAIVMAAIPGPNGVIHACYSNNTPLLGNGSGAVRIIDSAATCKSNETAITWNQQGPAGSQGPTGPQGPAGPGGMERAYLRINTDGTMDTNYSQNISNFQKVVYGDPTDELYAFCISTTGFTPKTSHSQGNEFLVGGGIAGFQAQVDQQCGEGFDAVSGPFFGGDPETGSSPHLYFSDLPALRTIFIN